MSGFLNDPDRKRADTLRGFARLNERSVILDEGLRFVRRRTPKRDRVALVSGGGSGHEPMNIGFVGHGMLDAACPGELFTSPTPDQIACAAEAVDAGRGVLMMVPNYSGDVMNFAMAADALALPTATVVVDDDVAIPRVPGGVGRRGIAGILIVEKLVGAAAEKGADLRTLQALGTRAVARVSSMGVALKACTNPHTDLPNFALDMSEMEIGVGIHGEAGRDRRSRTSADDIATELVTATLADVGVEQGEQALILLNGFGATPIAELCLMAESVGVALARAGVHPKRWLAGNFMTSLDMAGCSLTIAMLDAELASLWDAPVDTPAWRW